MMVFGMTLAVEMKINPAMLAAIIFLGAAGGGMSPLAATGIIGLDLCQGFGLTGIEMPLLVNGILSSTVYAALVYVAFGGYKLKSDVVLQFSDIPAFNKEQIITLIGIAGMVGLVLLFKVNVGLASFTVAMVLSGVMSWFSSTSGVVMPTLIPTIPHIIQQMSISVNPVEWVTAISMVSNTAGISPLSTGGALALAAYSAEAGAAAGELDRLFIKMFSISAAGVVTLSILAYFGFYRWLL